jgi:NAD+ diphosphatase
MRPIEHFKHCPKCGQPLPDRAQPNSVSCPACGFLHFFNPTVAVAAFVKAADGRILFIRRAKEPGKGRLAPPGGFVDFDETAEEALRREIREEVGVELESIRYLCSAVNQYPYRGVTYPVLDLFFVATVADGQRATALDDVESCLWLDPGAVREQDLAFISMQAAFRSLLQQLARERD